MRERAEPKKRQFHRSSLPARLLSGPILEDLQSVAVQGKTCKVWQFKARGRAAPEPRDEQTSYRPHCAGLVQLPLGHLGSALQTSSGRHLYFLSKYFVFLYALKCRVLRSQMCSASC